MIRKSILALSLVLLLIGMGVSSAHAYSRMYFCTEYDCSSITVIFGGQTHPEQLRCGITIGFINVPAGTYSFSASGCNGQWSGNVTVDGSSDYGIALCPPAAGSCCPRGQGCNGGRFICDECKCPVMAALPGDREAADLLRDFRDTTLSNSLEGIALTQLYYTHSKELRGILLRSPLLAAALRQVVLDNLYAVEQCMRGEPVLLDEASVAEADQLLEALQLKAGPELSEDLGTIRAELASGELFQSLCH